MNAIVPIGGNALIPQSMDDAIRLAKAMSTIPELPKHLHGSVGTCLMVVDQAMRWRMSPFAVAQHSFNIGGKMGYEGKIMAAAVESMGAIVGGFDYQFDGEGDDRTVTVSATRAGETQPRSMKIRLGDVKTTNEMWKKQPEQQLVYSGSRNWARRWTPAALLGAYAPEEFDRGHVASEPVFTGTTVDHEPPVETKDEEPSERDRINTSVPLRAAAADMKRADKIADKAKVYDTGDQADTDRWLINLETKLAAAQSQAEVMKIGELKSVKAAREAGRSEVQDRVMELLANAYARFPNKTWTPDLSEDAEAEAPKTEASGWPGDEVAEVEIVGAEKVAAG